jgi:hypothetical protein
MIRTFAALSITALMATSLVAAPCRDAKGKFIKCPDAKPAAAAAAPAVNKDAKGRCHVASGPKKGQLTACPK